MRARAQIGNGEAARGPPSVARQRTICCGTRAIADKAQAEKTALKVAVTKAAARAAADEAAAQGAWPAIG